MENKGEGDYSHNYRNLVALLAQAKKKDIEEDYSNQDQKLELLLKQEELFGRRQDREQRKEFAQSIFDCVMLYLFSTLLIVVFAGMKHGLVLSDGVMIALLTTASANVIGILLIVVRYLFHHHK